jgi:hypothetical protein
MQPAAANDATEIDAAAIVMKNALQHPALSG